MGQDDPKGKDESLIGPPPVTDAVEVLGKTSAEMIIPDPVVASVRGDTAPPVDVWSSYTWSRIGGNASQ
jgi:hypothetical protein